MRLTLGTPFCRLFEKQVLMPLDIAESAIHSLSRAVVRESAVVRFAGDSGDGMQLSGNQFTLSTALAGNALATFPDFPAEIRAPQGSDLWVSGFPDQFWLVVHRDRGRRARRVDRDEPGGAQGRTCPRSAPGRTYHRRRPALSRTQPAKAGYAANPLEMGRLRRSRWFRSISPGLRSRR